MEYEEIIDLEDISKKAKERIGSSSYLINFDLKVRFRKNLINNRMNGVYKDAFDFQNPSRPDTLYMNHGEYIHKCGDGINNVINQLKEKHASNRAIISLINQEDIMESKDNPIPSFMILQFSIEENTKLYLTTYFRALEVSKFLRINTEEIRQIIEKILVDNIQLNEIYLNIFAFRSYIDSDINPLKKPEIDTFDKQGILQYLLNTQTNLNKLIDLLNEKNTSSTVIKYFSFQNILNWIEDSRYCSIIHSDLKKPLVSKYLKHIIDILIDLERLRKQTSHNELIDEKQKLYKSTLNQLIEVIRDDS